MKRRLFFVLILLIVGVRPGWGQLPESGRPVPSLADFDAEMQDFMDDNAIGAGVLGVMRKGKVVYLCGFGTDYNGNALPENALFRLAYVQQGSKMRLFSGSTGWTGTLSKRLLLDAPLGAAVIGE